MFNFVYEIKKGWQDYDGWLKTGLPYLSNMEVFQRKEKCPELLRKLKSVFTLFRILDILFFPFSITGFVYWVLYVYRTRNLKEELSVSNDNFTEDYLTDTRSAYTTLEHYIDFNSLVLIILSFRLMEYLKYAGSMKVLTTTIAKSLEDIIYFFLMLMIFIIGFAGMGNIVFGQVSESFGTFGDSLISCFLIALGSFDIKELQEKRSLTTLFFLFIFLILFSYVLLNILFAILEINFTLAKEEADKQDKKVRMLNLLTCCCTKIPAQKILKEKNESKVGLRNVYEHLNEMEVKIRPMSHSMR
jgi:hypothetical protein